LKADNEVLEIGQEMSRWPCGKNLAEDAVVEKFPAVSNPVKRRNGERPHSPGKLGKPIPILCPNVTREDLQNELSTIIQIRSIWR